MANKYLTKKYQVGWHVCGGRYGGRFGSGQLQLQFVLGPIKHTKEKIVLHFRGHRRRRKVNECEITFVQSHTLATIKTH